jgi:hypothetical protein
VTARYDVEEGTAVFLDGIDARRTCLRVQTIVPADASRGVVGWVELSPTSRI